MLILDELHGILIFCLVQVSQKKSYYFLVVVIEIVQNCQVVLDFLFVWRKSANDSVLISLSGVARAICSSSTAHTHI